jgi:hypothetical protein
VKHLTHALAILSSAEIALQRDFQNDRLKAIAEVESKHALRLRLIKDAKAAIQTRLTAASIKNGAYWDELRSQTPKETNDHIRRAQTRERRNRAKAFN